MSNVTVSERDITPSLLDYPTYKNTSACMTSPYTACTHVLVIIPFVLHLSQYFTIMMTSSFLFYVYSISW